MRSNIISAIVVAALLAGFLAWRSHPEWFANYHVGEPAADFELALLDGGKFHLRGSAGQPTLVVFFATWCGPCRYELPTIDRLWQRFRDRGVRVLAIDIEDASARAALNRLVKDAGLSLPIALDGQEAADAYQVESLPHAVLIDGEGNLRRVFIGPHAEAEFAYALRSLIR